MDLITVANIENRILVIRGQRVMLDSDLADIYGVETKQLVQAVKRNTNRFPEDFMFRLTREEYFILRSQSVTSSQHGGRRYPPYAFTEHGALMLASVLRSDRAVSMSIYVVRAFARLREMISTHEDLKRKIEEMESRYDHQFKIVFDALRELIDPPPKPRKRIGFIP
jgi:phage regulator Rha-like protein